MLLATCATVIASQAVITGTYSLTQQAIQLGLLPRLEIQHTSESLVGQIYMPRVNWTLLAAVLALVFLFEIVERAGERLRHRRHRHDGRDLAARLHRLPPRLEMAARARARGDGAAPRRSSSIFLGANLAKLFDGGYVPLIIAADRRR